MSAEETFTTEYPPDGRGCGDRDEEKPYLCCGTSPYGLPIEKFIIDPVRPWPGDFQRGVKILLRDETGVNDVMVFVSQEDYPSTWDFFEETRRFGASRKVSDSFPFDQLTPGESRMVFVHARAIPDFIYTVDRDAPLDGCKHDTWRWKEAIPGWHPCAEADIPCTFALRDLSFFTSNVKAGYEDEFMIEMPSFTYNGRYPIHANTNGKNPIRWAIGLFLALPITHIEWKNRSGSDVEKRVRDAGFDSVVLEW